MAQFGGLPPVIQGFRAARQDRAQEEAQQIGILSRLMQIKQAQEQGALSRQLLQQKMAERQQLAELIQKDPRFANDPTLGALIQANPGGALSSLLPKPPSHIPIGAGGTLLPDQSEPGGFRRVEPSAKQERGFNPPEILKLQQALETIPPGHPSRKMVEARMKFLTEKGPGVTVQNMPATSDTLQGADGRFYKVRIGKDGKTETIPLQTSTGEPLAPPKTKAGESGLSGEAAGKAAMADQAMVDIRSARNRLFDKNGNMNRGLVFSMNAPFTSGVPGDTDARNTFSELQNAVAAKLRIETGAAATESEVKGILSRFMPGISDTSKSAAGKLDRLESFMSSTLDQMKGVRRDKLRSAGQLPAGAPPPPPGFKVDQ